MLPDDCGSAIHAKSLALVAAVASGCISALPGQLRRAFGNLSRLPVVLSVSARRQSMTGLSRRDVLAATALVIVGETVARAGVVTGHLPWHPDAGSPPQAVRPGPWQFFTDPEAAAVEAATASGVQCILNPAPVVPAVLRIMPNGPLLTPNATELNALVAALDQTLSEARTLENDFPDDLQAVTERARRLADVSGAPVVVTIGGDGALIVSPDGRAEHLPAPPAAVRDTTGAGDTFNGVLAARLAAGDHLGVAVRTAIVAASISVAHVGARAGMPSAAIIAAGLRSS